LQIVLNKVLLVGTRSKAYIGQPVVTNAAVHAVVEEQVALIGVYRDFRCKKALNSVLSICSYVGIG